MDNDRSIVSGFVITLRLRYLERTDQRFDRRRRYEREPQDVVDAQRLQLDYDAVETCATIVGVCV
jgi:hypothetical protein